MQNLDIESKIYMDILLNKPEGRPGRQYLKQRGITKNTAIEWQMGYSPIDFVPEIYKNEEYNFWDKMWGRVTFGIYDSHGNIVSISGRRVIERNDKHGKPVPKYDHYKFNAKNHLFGLHKNKYNIFNEQKGIITEGQLDVISAWQKGLKIVTSSFGAHCSEEHIALLSRYTKNIYVIYDNDAAGKEGLKLVRQKTKWLGGDINIELKNPFNVGQDMDEWFKTHTVDEFYKLIDNNPMTSLYMKLNAIKYKQKYMEGKLIKN